MPPIQRPFEIDATEKERAGYNQAQRITETLAMLRNTYVGSMMADDFTAALKVARRILDIISAKLEVEEIKKADTLIRLIKLKLPFALVTYEGDGGRVYFTYQNVRDEVEILIEKLWRYIEKLQDEHGYGMLAEEEYGL